LKSSLKVKNEEIWEEMLYWVNCFVENCVPKTRNRSLKQNTPLCRVLPSHEPAYAGRARSDALPWLVAYRIAIANKGPYFQVLAQDLAATIASIVGYSLCNYLYHILFALKSVQGTPFKTLNICNQSSLSMAVWCAGNELSQKWIT